MNKHCFNLNFMELGAPPDPKLTDQSPISTFNAFRSYGLTNLTCYLFIYFLFIYLSICLFIYLFIYFSSLVIYSQDKDLQKAYRLIMKP